MHGHKGGNVESSSFLGGNGLYIAAVAAGAGGYFLGKRFLNFGAVPQRRTWDRRQSGDAVRFELRDDSSSTRKLADLDEAGLLGSGHGRDGGWQVAPADGDRLGEGVVPAGGLAAAASGYPTSGGGIRADGEMAAAAPPALYGRYSGLGVRGSGSSGALPPAATLLDSAAGAPPAAVRPDVHSGGGGLAGAARRKPPSLDGGMWYGY